MTFNFKFHFKCQQAESFQEQIWPTYLTRFVGSLSFLVACFGEKENLAITDMACLVPLELSAVPRHV